MKQFLFIPLCWFFFLSAEAQSPNCVWAKGLLESSINNSSGNFSIDDDHNILMINNGGSLNYISNSLPYGIIPGTLIIKYDSNGQLLWFKKILRDTTNISGDIFFWSIKTDQANNVYACAHFTKTVFVENQSFTSSGSYDMLLIKYDKNGNLQWAKKAGGQLYDQISYDCFKVNKEGTIFFAGSIASHLNVQNPIPDTILVQFDTLSIYIHDSAYGHAFLACYNTDGSVRWVKQKPSSSITGATLPWLSFDILNLDKNNNLYLSGRTGVGMYWDSVPVQPYTSPGNSINFVLKCDSNGSALFSKSIINKYLYNSNYVATDSDGNFYNLPMLYTDTSYIDGVPYQFPNGCYCIKFDSGGNLIWKREVTKSFYGRISIDKDNNLLLANNLTQKKSVLYGDTIYSQDPADILLLKLNNNNGNIIWKKLIKNKGNDYALTLLPDTHNIFYFSGTFDADTFCVDNNCIKRCSSSTLFLAKFHQYPTDIEPIPFYENTLILYPNPAHQTITINRAIKKPNQLRVIDALGRIVAVNYNIIGNNTEINIATLPVGLYMVFVNDGNDVTTAKLMKE